MNIILRRRKLGATSCNAIASLIDNVSVVRNWVAAGREWPSDWGPEPLFVFRWGCTSNLVGTNHVVVNTSAAIHWCSDKRQGRLDMQAAGVSVPKTWGTASAYYADCEFQRGTWIVRPERHAQGRHVFFCESTGEVFDAVKELRNGWGTESYISEFINKVAEYRVYVIQGRVACVASKTPADPSAVAWNVAQGGRFDNVKWGQWPMAAIKEALAAAKVGGLDFCGVDVMMDAEGKAYVLEVNSAPSLTSPYRQKCFAKCFEYILNNGKAHIDVANVSNWKNVIHPAIWEG